MAVDTRSDKCSNSARRPTTGPSGSKLNESSEASGAATGGGVDWVSSWVEMGDMGMEICGMP